MNKKERYSILLRWSIAQHAYIGQVQELDGVEGSGKSYEEALASVLQTLRWRQERNGEGESSPFSQMLVHEPSEAEEGEEPPEAR